MTKVEATVSKSRLLDTKYQLMIVAVVFFGLFLIEYPPLFLAGYWSWGYWPHKILSGIFIVVNLSVTLTFVRRYHFFRNGPRIDGLD